MDHKKDRRGSRFGSVGVTLLFARFDRWGGHVRKGRVGRSSCEAEFFGPPYGCSDEFYDEFYDDSCFEDVLGRPYVGYDEFYD